MSTHAHSDRSDGPWLLMWGGLTVFALLLFLGLVLALPAEVGARLQHGRWMVLSLPVLWHVVWGWLQDVQGGAMVGWPASDGPSLPTPRLYAVLLVVELVLAILLAAGGTWAVVGGIGRWSGSDRRYDREDALSRARGRLNPDGRAGTRGLRR